MVPEQNGDENVEADGSIEKTKRWTAEEMEFLKANHDKMSTRELSERLKTTESSVNNKLRRLRLKRNIRWTRTKILDAIQKRANMRKDLTASDVQKDDNQLYSATCRHFGTWIEAIHAAGLDYDIIKGRKKA